MAQGLSRPRPTTLTNYRRTRGGGGGGDGGGGDLEFRNANADGSAAVGYYTSVGTVPPLIAATLQAAGLRPTTGDDWSLMWLSSSTKACEFGKLLSRGKAELKHRAAPPPSLPTSAKRISSFPRSQELTRKDSLSRKCPGTRSAGVCTTSF